MELMVDSFEGGVEPGRAGQGELRARVAVHGANLEALTSDETFRIPFARCVLARAGQKILVRDELGSLVIWSDDEAFLDALARAQRGTLKDQVGRLRGAKRRRRVLELLGKALIGATIVVAVSAPFTRWAVRGGLPTTADWLGQSALKQLDLPSGMAPAVERQLDIIAEQLRPACSPATRSFRVLLAHYADVHSFSMPPDAVIVTAGLVCGADDPNLVTAAVARELAHLENRDVSQYVAEAVEWRTPLDLALGDVTTLREHMLDFADPRRFPGFTPEQETAASARALAMLARAGVHLAEGQDLASLMARPKQLSLTAAENVQPPHPASKDGTLDWEKVRAEACSLIGR
jgi:hypothetical protein